MAACCERGGERHGGAGKNALRDAFLIRFCLLIAGGSAHHFGLLELGKTRRHSRASLPHRLERLRCRARKTCVLLSCVLLRTTCDCARACTGAVDRWRGSAAGAARGACPAEYHASFALGWA